MTIVDSDQENYDDTEPIITSALGNKFHSRFVFLFTCILT